MLSVGALAAALTPIKHFVVLLMENRAFDHMFGCAEHLLPGIDGLKPDSGNWIDPNDHSKGFQKVQCGAAQYVCKHGAGQSFMKTAHDIFGPDIDPSHGPYPNATMEWFVNYSGSVTIENFAPEQLPVKMALAREFAVFNKLYAAIPGPSQPNHMFAQSATSCGVTQSGVAYTKCGGHFPLFGQRTIYDALKEAGHDFNIFYNSTITEGGVPGDIYMSGILKYVPFHSRTFTDKDGFLKKAKEGKLPKFSWILPNHAGKHPNDDHPCHDVARGEEFLKTVYEALRSGKGWNETALLVVYDDPGGFYDHMPPPNYAPKPGASCEVSTGCPDKFAFDRLGVRLTNILISPLIPKGTVIQDPDGPVGSARRPYADSKYELSSIPATVKNLFGLPKFLTHRDAWAGSFHDVFSLKEPRTDTPEHLPDAPPFSDEPRAVHGCGSPTQVTRRQKRHLDFLSNMLNRDSPDVEQLMKQEADVLVGSMVTDLFEGIKNGSWHPVLDEL
mmetsp:Transcript_20438/g.37255  ORF Transcript_20438/g.37255 Transcript_20438/m.37255 type:complete len:500 (+) Transcript_20438:75-1574(+)